MRDPLYIYLHRAIATSIAPRSHSRDKVNTSDLFFLYCLLMRRTCALATSLVDFFHTAYHRQARGDLYGGAYVTVIARYLGLVPEDDPLVSAGIPSSPIAASNARSMRILRDYPGLGPRLRAAGGRARYIPVPLPAAADIPVFEEQAPGVPAPVQQQQDDQHQQQQPDAEEDVGDDGPDPPQPPQQQYPQHMYDDLSPAVRRVAQDFDRRLRGFRMRQDWMIQTLQAISTHMGLPVDPVPDSPPPHDHQ